MGDQPRSETYEASDFFADGLSARPPVPGTVSRRARRADSSLTRGKRDGEFVTALPLELNRELLRRGQERFGIFCAPCHDAAGTGRGIVVLRGYRQPVSFHDDRLRASPVGYYFEVMTHGFGTMPNYAASVSPRDRWAIAAYIRALQLSQHARPDDLPADELARLEEQS
jgi:mono/diheme cytochrome c family protein